MRLLIFMRKRGIFVILEILPGRLFLIMKEEDQGIKNVKLVYFPDCFPSRKKGASTFLWESTRATSFLLVDPTLVRSVAQ